MNVIVSNEKKEQLSNLDADIIKSVTGQYEASELVEMFKDFFFSKMIIDVTALKNYSEVNVYQSLIQGLSPEKIIFLLPEGSTLCTPEFLSNLISIGIYNFTTDLKGIYYLLKNPNKLEDVEHILKMVENKYEEDTGAVASPVATRVDKECYILGVRDLTDGAGATSLIYMLKKELSTIYGFDNVIALEIDKNDFGLLAEKNMFSISKKDIQAKLSNYSNTSIILVDLNNCDEDSFCTDIIYLLEPSTIKLNRLIRKDRNIFGRLANCKIVLNKSMLLNNDVYDFEKEARIKVFYNMPPLDERKRNAIISDFLKRLGLVNDEVKSNYSNKIFGLFRR